MADDPGATFPSDFEGDPDLAAVAAEFRAGVSGRMDAFRSARARADWPVVAALAHRLRGDASLCGFSLLGRAAAAVEDAIRAARGAPVLEAVAPLVDEVLTIGRRAHAAPGAGGARTGSAG